jgi:hypothetical protein
MLYRVPMSVDRAVARDNAVAVGALIGARATSSRRTVVGEPVCPYELRWNADPFWFGVRISESAYVVQGNHKKRFEPNVAFYASLKGPNPAMLTRLPLESLSKELGVAVFVAEPKYGSPTADALRSAQCSGILRRLLFAPVRSLFLSPVQIYGISDFVTPQQCAEQATLLRSLLLALWQWNSRISE